MSLAASAFEVTNANKVPEPEQDILTYILTIVLDGFTSSDLVAVVEGAVGYA